MRISDDDPGRLDRVARYGTIESVDLAAARCVVRAGDVLTHPIRWAAAAAGATRSWSPPSVGEQVLILCPGGDDAAAIALRGIGSTANPAPGDSLRELVRFSDGTILAYDPEAQRLELLVAAGGTVHLVADGGLTIDAPVTINGDVTIAGDVAVTGKIDATGDVVGQGTALHTHKHTGVQTGGGVSGVPQ
jgi:phage baseplate assembly protein V